MSLVKAIFSYLALMIGFAGWLVIPVIALALLPVVLVGFCMIYFFVKFVIEGAGGLDEQLEGY